VAIQDVDGISRPDWIKHVSDCLSGSTKAGQVEVRKLPRILNISGHVLALADISCADRQWGVLAIAVPSKASDKATSFILAMFAQQLGEGLLKEALQSETVLGDESPGQARLADLGELAGALMHSLNNYLNVISLHLAILEAEIQGDLRPEL